MTAALPLRARLRLLFAGFDTKPIEILYTFLTLAWGLWLLLPGDTFKATSAFALMENIAREEVWGLFAVVIGLSRVTGLLYGIYPLRILAAWGGFAIWCMTWICIVLKDPHSTGFPVYFVLSSFCGLVCVRLIREWRGVRSAG